MKSSSAHRRNVQATTSARRASGICALGAATLLAASAASAQPQPFLAEQLDELTASVTAIDSAERLLTLQTDDGRQFTVQAGDEVRNFAQIEIGDQVNVMFYEALAAEVTDAPQTTERGPVVLGSRRAAAGESPAGAAGLVYTAIVTINSIDPATSTVSFTGPGGQPRQATVQSPEGQAFVSELKPGDRVQLTYGEAIAVAVTPTDESRQLR